MRLSLTRLAMFSVSISSALACVAACLAGCSNGGATPIATPQVATITPDAVDAAPTPVAPLAASAAPSSGTGASDGSPAMTAATAAADASGPDFSACATDTECVAVKKNACCNHGELEAVATSQASAYKASFTCPSPRPKCPMYLRRDLRVAVCDTSAQHCVMTAPEELACGSSSGAHACPSGFHCASGKCTK